MFVRTLEHCLYGGSSGAVNKLFARCAKASRACPLRLTLKFTPARPSQHSRGAFQILSKTNGVEPVIETVLGYNA